MKNEDKARALLTHIGRAINMLNGFTDAELEQLAGIYDLHVGESLDAMRDGFDAFWAEHLEVLKAGKATTPATDEEEDGGE